MPVKATHIAEKARDAFLFPLFSTGKSGTFCVKSFAKKFSVSDRTAWVYYTNAKKAYEAITDDWNACIRQMDSEVLQTIKDSLKAPYETAAELQGEIESIQTIIEQGYILRKIKVGGEKDEREIYEPIKTSQLVQLHRIMDEKRDRIAKIRGDYQEQEQQDTDEVVTAKSLTREELQERIKNLEKD